MMIYSINMRLFVAINHSVICLVRSLWHFILSNDNYVHVEKTFSRFLVYYLIIYFILLFYEHLHW